MSQLENEVFSFIVNGSQKRVIQDKLLHSAHPHHALRFELITFCGFLYAEASLLRVKDVLGKRKVYLPDLVGYESLRSQRPISVPLTSEAIKMINEMTKGLDPEDALFTTISKNGEKEVIEHSVFYLTLKYHAQHTYAINISAETLRISFLYNALVKYKGDYCSLLREQGLQNSALLKKAFKLYKLHNKTHISCGADTIAEDMSLALTNLLSVQQSFVFAHESIDNDTKKLISNSVYTISNELQTINDLIHINQQTEGSNQENPELSE